MNDPKWKLVKDVKAKVGECPIWVPEQASLYWIDQFEPSLNRFNLYTGLSQSWEMPRSIGSYGLATDLRTGVVALADGIYRIEFSSGNLEMIHPAPYDVKHYRFNDGRVDRMGRFWVGSLLRFSSNEPPGLGSFWRMDERGLVRVVDGVTIGNGIAWSPDDTTMYIADGRNWQILAYDFNALEGTTSNPRTFAHMLTRTSPDGASVDCEGCYWIALPRTGKIARYSPDGDLLNEILAPVSTPTMVAFGGEDLKTLFLTSSRSLLQTPAEIEREPLAGGIFSLEVEVSGVPEPRLRNS